MKKFSILLLTLSFLLTSCSSDSDNNDDDDDDDTTPAYAMTAKINGTNFQANNPFNNNMFSSTNIWSYYPEEDYVMLQGRQGGTFGTPEINIWLKKTDIAVGTYTIGYETFDTPPSHFIDLIDNNNSVSETTKGGVIVITQVNTSTKIVKGTFQFTSTDGDVEDPASAVNFTVSEGTFTYQYAE
jgi:hypothetical protein